MGTGAAARAPSAAARGAPPGRPGCMCLRPRGTAAAAPAPTGAIRGGTLVEPWSVRTHCSDLDRARRGVTLHRLVRVHHGAHGPPPLGMGRWPYGCCGVRRGATLDELARVHCGAPDPLPRQGGVGGRTAAAEFDVEPLSTSWRMCAVGHPTLSPVRGGVGGRTAVAEYDVAPLSTSWRACTARHPTPSPRSRGAGSVAVRLPRSTTWRHARRVWRACTVRRHPGCEALRSWRACTARHPTPSPRSRGAGSVAVRLPRSTTASSVGSTTWASCVSHLGAGCRPPGHGLGCWPTPSAFVLPDGSPTRVGPTRWPRQVS